MAMGMVGLSGRTMKSVAPNSPRETAKAKPAPINSARADQRQVQHTPRSRRRRTKHGGRLVHASVQRSEDGRDGTNHERQSNQGMGDRDEPRRHTKVNRQGAQRDQQPEAQDDSRRPQRQREQRVEQPWQPAATSGDHLGGDQSECCCMIVAIVAYRSELPIAAIGGTASALRVDSLNARSSNRGRSQRESQRSNDEESQRQAEEHGHHGKVADDERLLTHSARRAYTSREGAGRVRTAVRSWYRA